MRAMIRSIDSPDVDVATYTSETPENDGFLLSLYVGPSDGPGEESFDLMVCTPLWLRGKVKEQGPLVGRHYLIVEPLDLTEVKAFLTRHVERLEASSWDELAEKIARLGHWEFEDYRP